MKRIYYCSALKKSGKPIVVHDLDKKTTTTTNKITGYGRWRVKFNNARGREKSTRGVTTVLEVWD